MTEIILGFLLFILDPEYPGSKSWYTLTAKDACASLRSFDGPSKARLFKVVQKTKSKKLEFRPVKCVGEVRVEEVGP